VAEANAGLTMHTVTRIPSTACFLAAKRTAERETGRQTASPPNQKNWWCRRLGLSYFHFSGLGLLLYWRM
jgi:hypothetical protein